jgi:hypothetical protein
MAVFRAGIGHVSKMMTKNEDTHPPVPLDTIRERSALHTPTSHVIL